MSDRPMITIEDVIRDFGSTGHVLPRASMRWSLDNWAVAAPRFLDLLVRYAGGTDQSGSAADALFFIIHLMGEKHETAAFGDLCRLLLDRRRARAVFEDAITTTLRRILISTFDGDVAALRSVIEASEADEFVRDATILAMAYLVRTGRIPEAETHAYLRHLLTAMQPQGPCYVWVGWTECVAALGFGDFAPDVKLLFERGFIEDFTMAYSDFEEDLKLTLDDPERMAGLTGKGLAPFTGTIDELGRWHGFSEAARNALVRQPPPRQPAWTQGSSDGSYRNPLRQVGRNDPCPCGSGRKFKKCCLGKADSDASADSNARAA